MAPKPKKTAKMPTGERPKQLSPLAARTARDVGSASQGAAIAGRNRDFAKKQAAKKASYSPKLMGIYEQYDMGRSAKNKMVAKADAKRLKATKYAPAPMTAKQKETIRRAAEKKQALKNLKKDPIVKGTKAALKTGLNPVGAGIKAASTAAGMAVKGVKAIAKEVRGPKRQVGKMGPIKPMIKKLKDSSDKATKKK